MAGVDITVVEQRGSTALSAFGGPIYKISYDNLTIILR